MSPLKKVVRVEENHFKAPLLEFDGTTEKLAF